MTLSDQDAAMSRTPRSLTGYFSTAGSPHSSTVPTLLAVVINARDAPCRTGFQGQAKGTLGPDQCQELVGVHDEFGGAPDRLSPYQAQKRGVFIGARLAGMAHRRQHDQFWGKHGP